MKIPRRYGKNNILMDIENQGGNPTPLQELMLSINDLKNTYVNLSKITIHDYFNDVNLLSNKDCKTLKSIIENSVQKMSAFSIHTAKSKKVKKSDN